MNYPEWKNQNMGKTIGYPDGNYVGECLSEVKKYIKDCFGINPPTSGVTNPPEGAAFGYWTNFLNPLGSVFEKIANTPTGVPQQGDIVVWGARSTNKYGHIAIFDSGNTNSFTSLDQNWNGKKVHLQTHNYDNVLGWLHPKKNATKGDEMIPENLLPGRLERDPDGKVWWWTENGDWFHNRMDLCVQRPDYNQIIKDLENRPPVEKIVEKPVDRPETLIELKKAQETIVELKKTISDNTKTHATELTTCEAIKDDLILQKSDWIKEMADYDKKYYLIPRDTFKKWITRIVELIKKVYNLRKDKK